MPEAILTKTPPPYSERLFFLAMKGYSPGGGGVWDWFTYYFSHYVPLVSIICLLVFSSIRANTLSYFWVLEMYMGQKIICFYFFFWFPYTYDPATVGAVAGSQAPTPP